jgi:hypothetical protein
MKKRLILTLIFIFLLASFSFMVSAAIPFQTSPVEETLNIFYPQHNYIKVGQNFTLNIHVTNSTAIITNDTGSCEIETYNYFGIHVLDNVMDFSDDDEFSLFINSQNFSSISKLAFFIQCNTSNEVGSVNGFLEINNLGFEQTTSESINSSIILALFVTLTIMFLIVGFKLSETENLWVLGIFLMGISLFFLVYDLYLGYAYSLNYVGTDMSRIPEILFFIFAIGLAAGLLVSTILSIRHLPKIIEWFKVNFGKKENDDWDNNNYD